MKWFLIIYVSGTLSGGRALAVVPMATKQHCEIALAKIDGRDMSGACVQSSGEIE